MKDNFQVIVLTTVIVLLVGASVVFGIGNMISLHLGPLTTQMGKMSAIQEDIQKKLNDYNVSNVSSQIQLLNQRIGMLEARGGGRQGQPPSQGQGGCGAPQVGQGGGCAEDQRAGGDPNQVYNIDLGPSPVLGKKDAPVTIVAFLDLQCPYCNKFFPAVENVVKAYPDKVKVVIKNYPLPFHPNALPAAKLALAAGLQGKYFETVNLLLQNQASVTDDKVKEYAKQLGMNYDKLMEDYKNKDAQWQKIIDEEKALGERVQVNGTPTFYINGKKTNARDLESYKVEVEKILAGNK
jgi:protein-disulfide isomerase